MSVEQADRRSEMGPELHAVVEVDLRPEGSWVALPREPWPRFVRLAGSATDSDIALLVGVASSYGRTDQRAAESARALLADFPHVLPGGIAVVAPERSIFPGCCCGLEGWPDWRHVLETGAGPWTGHDPAPLVEVVGDEVRVWSDGGLSARPQDEQPLTFARSEFVEALDRVSADLEEFLPRLRRWLDIHAPLYAKRLVERFADRFVRPKRRRR